MKPVKDTRSPAAIRQARYRERKKLREMREAPAVGPEVIEPSRPRISAGLLAASRRRPSRAPVNPFSVGSLHPPSIHSANMAMDDATQATINWAGNQLSALVAEGQTFLGYPVLAEMAQRPEYRRVSEVIARHMTRKWIKLTATGDIDKSERIQQIEDRITALKVKDAFKEAAEMDGLFGRGHIHIDIGPNDEREMLTPIGDGWGYASRVKVTPGSIKSIRAIEPVWCYPLDYNSSDPLSPYWYKPKTWMVMSRKLHNSRLLTLIGREVPDLLKPAYSFGGLSLSQMIKPYVDNWLRTRQSVSDLIHSFSVSGIKTSVNDALLTSEDQLVAKADFFNNMRDNRGLLLLDKDTEDFFNVSTPLGTLDKLQAQALENIASICAIPLVELLGTTPTGLNASSEGEIRVFQEMIHANQENLFREPLTRILGFIMLDLFGEVDEDIDFEFEPLWDMGEDEKASIRKTDADTDSVLVNAGIISVEESRQRIAADPNTVYAGLNPQAKPELEEQKKSEIAQRDTMAVVEAFSQAVIDHATALAELRKIAQRTGRFVNVTQRDIWEAEAEPPPMPAMGAGMPGMEGLPGAGHDPFQKSPGGKPGSLPGQNPSLPPTSSSSTTTARDGLALDFDPAQPRDNRGRWTSTGSFEIPTKTVKAYKLLATKRSRPGEYFATQINTAAPIRVGEWIPAENHPTKGFAARPGWHAGLLPLAPQMRAKSGMRRPDRVWAEVELPDDRSQEWQAAAAASPTKDLPGAIPVGGHYVYEPPSQKRFNSKWLIGGGLKINRILKHDEVRRILEEAGVDPREIAAETHDYPLAHDGAPIVAAGMMFRTPDDKVLLLKRKDGTWGFPGGSIEPGETPQWAAEREVHEETQANCDYELDPADEPYALTRTPDGDGMFATFLMAVNDPFEPLLNDEHSEHVWASIDDLPQPLHPGVAEAINGKTQAHDEFVESQHPRDAQGRFVDVYHGSPYDFDKFDDSKIGSGEGAQAYGSGLYFAENPETAKSYQKNLAWKGVDVDGINARLSDLSKVMEKHAVPGQYRKFRNPEGEKAAEEYDRLMSQKLNANGYLYKVRLHADPESFLDWDAPIAKQSKPVREALMRALADRLGPEELQTFPINPRKVTGGKAYAMLHPESRYNAAAASEMLSKAGIAGIRYLDAGSRVNGKGTRNYVLFDPSKAEIIGKDAVIAQDSFNEADHPRGQPKNKGQFRKKGAAAAVDPNIQAILGIGNNPASAAKQPKPGGVNSEFERTSNLFDAFYNYVTGSGLPKEVEAARALIDGFPKEATYKEQLAYVEEHVGKENMGDILEATRIMRSHDEGAFNELIDWAKDKKSGDYRFFHGTSSKAVESIMEKGLVPQGGPGGDAWASGKGMTVSGFTIGDRAASVYVTPDPDFAKDFALYAAEVTGSRAALLEVRIPADRAPDIFYDERSTGGGVRFKGTIPPEWISNRTIEAFGMDEAGVIKLYIVIPCTESDADEMAHDRDVTGEPRVPAGNPDGGQWTEGGANPSRKTELRIPQRLPTGVKSPDRGKGPKELVITLAAMRGDHLEGKQKAEAAEQFHHNMQLIKSYVGFKPVDGASDDETARAFIDECKGNLLWLYDKMPEDRRERAKLWYVGANRIAREKAKQYGLPLQSVAGCYAALSPQKDWFMNVSLGDRVMDLYFNHHADKWDEAMDSTAERLLAVEEKGAKGVKTSKGLLGRALPRIRGKSLDDIRALDLGDDEKLALEAAWIRIKDETNPDRTHPAISPEGEYGDPVKNLAGETKSITWGTYVATATAIECLASGGDMQRISAAMGEKHKVRNFYNNIVEPGSDLGDVTIDTHAVAAARLRPLAGSDPEVMHALHSGGAKGAMNTTGSSITGVKGLYPLYAEAYREAAKEVGVLPREMQSITWEEIRSMFPPTLKRDRGKIDKATGQKTISKPAQINAIWKDYTDGKRSIDNAREAIGVVAPAGEISWE